MKAIEQYLPEVDEIFREGLDFYDTPKENYFISGRGIVSSFYNVKNLEQRLSKYNISAPFNGILVEALVTEGTLIRNGQKLGEFAPTRTYYGHGVDKKAKKR